MHSIMSSRNVLELRDLLRRSAKATESYRYSTCLNGVATS